MISKIEDHFAFLKHKLPVEYVHLILGTGDAIISDMEHTWDQLLAKLSE